MTRSLTAPVQDAPTVASLLGITYSASEMKSFGPPPDPLDGFVTFFDPGWNILMLLSLAPKEKGRLFSDQSWYDTEPFAKTEELPRYHQVRIGPVTNSTRKSFDEQRKLLPAGEEVPTARV